MSRLRVFLPFAGALLLSLSVPAQRKEPTEAQCREMTGGMVQAMKSAPLEKASDKQGAKELIERIEKLVRDNRAKGVNECETWAAVAKAITVQ